MSAQSVKKQKKSTTQVNFNDFMHHRNPYLHNAPDFSKLAVEYPEFNDISTVGPNGKITLDFTNPDVPRILSRCLLKSDFDLEVDLPRGYLAPAVPQRLNYLLWCEDIVNISLGKSESVVAVDFGTGSSCVLPLLGVKQCSWRFLGVDANHEACEFAQQNVTRNNLNEYISIVQTSEGEINFEEFLQSSTETFDILLCNPPFYLDSWDANAAIKAIDQGRSEPNGDCRGEEHEKVTPGGELEFVRRVFEQSVVHKHRIQIASAMLGKKKDLKELSRFFRTAQVQFTTTEFCQGKSMRWGIAWTHHSYVDLSLVPSMKHLVPKPPLVFQVPRSVPGVKYTTETVCNRVKELLVNVQVKFVPVTEGKNNCHLRVFSEHNTLSGQRRRRRQRDRKTVVETVVPEVPRELLDEAAKFSKKATPNSVDAMDCASAEAPSSKRPRSSDEEFHSDEFQADSPMDCKAADLNTPVHNNSNNHNNSNDNNSNSNTNNNNDSNKNYYNNNNSNNNKRTFRRPEAVARFLNCDLRVRRTASGLIIQLQNRDATLNRDSLCQLQQYLRNNLCSQPKELALTMKMIV